MSADVLAGIRVVDFGKHVAGPWCAAILADLGADVVRVERPGGGDDRFVCPVADDGSGAMYLVVNRGKRGVTLRAGHPDARPAVDALVGWADVVVANLPSATRRAFGIDWDQAHAVNPRAILATATAFGEHGPYAGRIGFDGVAQVMSGAVHLTGEPGHPTRCYAPYVDFLTGSLLATGTLAALLARHATGEGQHVQGSLLGTALVTSNRDLVECRVGGIERQSTGNRGQTSGPMDVWATKDGHVLCSVIGRTQFERWAGLIGRPDLLDDDRFATDETRGLHNAVLSIVMGEWCSTRTTAEVLAELGHEIAIGPVLAPVEVLADPHVQAIGRLVDVEYPGAPAAAPIADLPFSLSATPGRIRGRAPTLGEHTDEVLREAGLDEATIVGLHHAGVA